MQTPQGEDLIDLTSFVREEDATGDADTWTNYLQNLRHEETWGDHVALYGLASMLNGRFKCNSFLSLLIPMEHPLSYGSVRVILGTVKLKNSNFFISELYKRSDPSFLVL